MDNIRKYINELPNDVKYNIIKRDYYLVKYDKTIRMSVPLLQQKSQHVQRCVNNKYQAKRSGREYLQKFESEKYKQLIT